MTTGCSSKYHNNCLLLFLLIDNPTTVEQAIYSSELTENSSKYSQQSLDPNYYYEPIQIIVAEDGFYAFESNSTIDTYGSIYKNEFDALDPQNNQIEKDDNYGCDDQFKLVVYLEKQKKYILVVTTHDSNTTGSFSIITFGPNEVTFTRTRK